MLCVATEVFLHNPVTINPLEMHLLVLFIPSVCIFQLLHQENGEWEQVRKEKLLQSFSWSQSDVFQVTSEDKML